ncbi:MAG: DnaJ domain-containing protein [Acidobacteria bacterium]|nr:DnaJ domain-containing protein [Acidobacteriota bacterium]
MRLIYTLIRIIQATPVWLRWVYVLLTALYVISPIDAAPDRIPKLGIVDDVILVCVMWFVFDRVGLMKPFFEQLRNPTQAEEAPHEVLGVPVNASKPQIKSAYRKMLRTYHPDRFAHLGEKYQKAAIERTQRIIKAYRQLAPN